MFWELVVLAGSIALLAAHQPLLLPGHAYPAPLKDHRLTKQKIFDKSKVVPDDLEVTTVIPDGNASYVYLHGTYGPLTIVVRPCGVSVNLTIYHIPQNNTYGFLKDYLQARPDAPVFVSRGSDLQVFSQDQAPAGLYLLDLESHHQQAVVTIYGTSLPSLPAALRIPQQPRVRVQPRLHRNRVTVRWDQSVVDPQVMHYCVVINTRRNITSYCEACNASGMNVHTITVVKPQRMENRIHHDNTIKPEKNLRPVGLMLGKNDIIIACVGAGLSYTISNLQRGQQYYFNIFAKNRNNELTFHYASKSIRYESKPLTISLQDNKLETVNIRRLGGRAIFRFKVGAHHSPDSVLTWHVMPCGGAVDVQVSLRHKLEVPRQTVEGYRQLQVVHPQPRQRYILLVTVPDPQRLKQITALEVLATMKTSMLPRLPPEAEVYEYASMRTCHSVTVGWTPVASQYVRYCVSATAVPVTDLEGHFRLHPNQCNLDSKLRSQFDFAVRHCQDFSPNDNRNVLVETIMKLKPGKEYLIQVTVKKMKGKALSYNLLRVRTKTDC